MKRFSSFFLLALYVVTCAPVCAQGRAPLGKWNLAVKLDYIVFTDNYWDDYEDDGIYLGLEGYGAIAENLYLGGEIGSAFNVDILGDEITFVPIELNLKYAMVSTSNLAIAVGAGASYNYTEIKTRSFFFEEPRDETTEDDWVFGGQFFGDLTYRFRWLSVGLNAKYQVTEKFSNEDFDLSNWRAGVQIGVVF